MTVDVSDDPTTAPPPPTGLPEPDRRRADRVAIRLAGIGGTGVVTVAQIISTAAMLDGWDTHGLDQTGLSQKAGPVVSDIVLAEAGSTASNLIGAGGADALVAFDALVGASDLVVAAVGEGTRVVGSTSRVPTGAMISHPEIDHPDMAELLDRLPANDPGVWLDSNALASRLFGSSTAANVIVLGAAVQAGSIPVSIESLETAITLNGVNVDENLAAFRWGRQAAIDPTAIPAPAAADDAWAAVVVPDLPGALARRIVALTEVPELRDTLTLRAADLVAYQDARYAARYLDVLERVAEAEGAIDSGSDLAVAVARALHRLMAYKDEYEVARLILGPEADTAARAVGGRGARPIVLLDPPILRALGRRTKMRFGPQSRPILRVLAGARRVRGTRLDPFGYARLRRSERRLVEDYIAMIDSMLPDLSEATLRAAVAIAELPDQIRGYEALKLRRIAEYESRVEEALTRWSAVSTGASV